MERYRIEENAALDQATLESSVAKQQTALEQMVQNSKNAAAAIGDALGTAFNNVMTRMLDGTASFKDIMVGLLRQVAAQLLRVYMLKLAVGMFSKFGSAGGGTGWTATAWDKAGEVFPTIAGKRAGGGAVNAGESYVVGEQGAELFTPSSSGNIATAAATRSMGSGGGGVQVVNNITVKTEGGTDDPNALMKTGQAIAAMVEAKVREVLTKESRQGGMLRRGYA
jgi:phage-related minor tail protein